jgi:hypothetical protein
MTIDITSIRLHPSEIINSLDIWFLVAATVLAMILSLAVGRVLVQRRRKRENLLMRDHLNRNFPNLRIE